MYKAWGYWRTDVKLVRGPPVPATLLCITQPRHLPPALCQLSYSSLHHHRCPSISVLALLAHTRLCKSLGCKGLPFGLLPWRFCTCVLLCRLGCAMLLCRL